MLALLEELGNPHLGRVTVHIAGSKGKGSVAAMVESMLRAAGLRTGLFTSPHLHRFPERIQIDGEPVSHGGVRRRRRRGRSGGRARAGSACRTAQLVTFDALTALGFLLFREHEVQAQVIEVGLGGTAGLDQRLRDARTAASSRTSASSTARFSATRSREIARQKAGIIVAGCPTVMAPQRESAADVIREVARRTGSPLTEVALRLQPAPRQHQRRGADLPPAHAQAAPTRSSCRCSASTSSTTPLPPSSRSKRWRRPASRSAKRRSRPASRA